MTGQRTGNYKGSEFRYLGGCWSHPLRGHVYGPGLATPKQFSKETEMEFPAGANSPLPVELGRPPPGLLTFQRALRDTSVTHLPHCAELQSDTGLHQLSWGPRWGSPLTSQLCSSQPGVHSRSRQGLASPHTWRGNPSVLKNASPQCLAVLVCLSSADLWSRSRRGVVCLSPQWGA